MCNYRKFPQQARGGWVGGSLPCSISPNWSPNSPGPRGLITCCFGGGSLTAPPPPPHTHTLPTRDKGGEQSLESAFNLELKMELSPFSANSVCSKGLTFSPPPPGAEGGTRATLILTQSVSEKPLWNLAIGFCLVTSQCHKRETHPLPSIELTLCETGRGLGRSVQAPFRRFRGGLFQRILPNKGCQTK